MRRSPTEGHRRLVEVMGRGIDFIHQRPDEARAIYFRRTQADPEDPLMKAIFDATVPCFCFDFDMSDRFYARLAHWMKARGLIAVDVDPQACWLGCGLEFGGLGAADAVAGAADGGGELFGVGVPPDRDQARGDVDLD